MAPKEGRHGVMLLGERVHMARFMDVQRSPQFFQPPTDLEGMHKLVIYVSIIDLWIPKYTLVAEVPVKGFRNSAKLVSRALEMSSGIAAGTNVIPTSEVDMMELPPGYFNTEGYDDDDVDDKKA